MTTQEQVTEAKKGDNYHSVFVQHDDGKWAHHFDADDKEDARSEMESLRNSGSKTKSFVVPKAEADWTKNDPHEYVTKRLQKTVKESLMDSIFSKNNGQAEDDFKTLMAEKVQAALDARKVEIAQSLYQRAQEAK